jgi:dihydrofolate reductase
MIVSIIAAVARNRVIGKNNDLPWHLPNDMRFFKEKTKGHHVLTGRKNYDSIPEKFRPLPGRTNIVVTRNENYHAPGAEMFKTIEEGIAFAKANGEQELFVMGGGQIYEHALQLALVDKMYITWVDAEPEGDIRFPDFDRNVWKEVESLENPSDERNAFAHTFTTYVR